MSASRVDRHPVRGFFAGLLLGVGVAFLLFVFGIVPMTILWFGVTMLVGCLLGVALAYLVPPRRHAVT